MQKAGATSDSLGLANAADVRENTLFVENEMNVCL